MPGTACEINMNDVKFVGKVPMPESTCDGTVVDQCCLEANQEQLVFPDVFVQRPLSSEE